MAVPAGVCLRGDVSPDVCYPGGVVCLGGCLPEGDVHLPQEQNHRQV